MRFRNFIVCMGLVQLFLSACEDSKDNKTKITDSNTKTIEPIPFIQSDFYIKEDSIINSECEKLKQSKNLNRMVQDYFKISETSKYIPFCIDGENSELFSTILVEKIDADSTYISKLIENYKYNEYQTELIAKKVTDYLFDYYLNKIIEQNATSSQQELKDKMLSLIKKKFTANNKLILGLRDSLIKNTNENTIWW